MSFFASSSSSKLPRSSTSDQSSLPPAPDSLLSHKLPRALLESSSQNDGPNHTDFHVPMPRPRTPWAVNDHSLKRIPKYYPPMDPNCTGFVPGTTASVVAFRISECLRQHSVAVEYDNESITANAMTVDRCNFEILFWKGKVTPTVDYSHGVVVECLRRNGSTISFHRVCSAILRAARGESSGADDRKPHQTNAMEYPRMPNYYDHFTSRPSSLSREPSAPSPPSGLLLSPRGATLEKVQELLMKDRLECQRLAMEQLIHLTTPSVCGDSLASSASKSLLREEWLYPYIVLQQSTGPKEEEEEEVPEQEVSTTSFLPKPTIVKRSISPRFDTSNSHCHNELEHETHMRAFALRVLFNALTNVHAQQGGDAQFWTGLLRKSPECPLFGSELLESLAEDLQGSNRPLGAIEASCRLASIHEAALAVGCLRMIVLAAAASGDSSSSTPAANRDDAFWDSERVLERFRAARSCGRSTHAFLQAQTDLLAAHHHSSF